MAEAVQYLHDITLLCLEHMPALAEGLPVHSSGECKELPGLQCLCSIGTFALQRVVAGYPKSAQPAGS